MGTSFSDIGHGHTPEIAIESALGYVSSCGYVLNKQAEIHSNEYRRVFYFIDGLCWYECILWKPKTTFISSLIYFARTEEELHKKLSPNTVTISKFKVDKNTS